MLSFEKPCEGRQSRANARHRLSSEEDILKRMLNHYQKSYNTVQVNVAPYVINLF